VAVLVDDDLRVLRVVDAALAERDVGLRVPEERVVAPELVDPPVFAAAAPVSLLTATYVPLSALGLVRSVSVTRWYAPCRTGSALKKSASFWS
jgi:hypothetical protein